MPPKKPRQSTRRNRSFTDDKGRHFNQPSLQRAPKAVSPRKFKTLKEAEKAQRRLGKRMQIRSGSAMRGTISPGGGKRKPK